MNMRFKKMTWRPFAIVAIVIAFIFLLALITKQGGSWLEKKILVTSTPGLSLTVDRNVEVETLFNNEPGTLIFSDRISEAIAKSEHKLEIAMYAFTSARLKEAVYEAHARGVEVDIITDYRKRDEHDIFFADAPKSINRRHVGSNRNLMHHKFAIIDRGYDSEKLIFGAFNWTDLQERYDPSFIMLSQDEDLIASFGREFDRIIRNNHGVKKLRNNDYYPWDLNLQALNGNYEVWFSPGRPGDGIKNRLLSMVSHAQDNIKIMIWDFTDRDLAVEIIKKARSGVKVTMIADTWNFENYHSVFTYLVDMKEKYNLDNFEFILDEIGGKKAIEAVADPDLDPNFDPFLHYHTLIVDDKEVLTGTNNWSSSGSFHNDESIMVTDNHEIVSAFIESFNYHYQINTEILD